MAAVTNPPLKQRADLIRRGQFLEYLTLAACSLEAAVSIGAGVTACSVALMGFGIDSVIELASGGAILWRLHHDADAGRRPRAEAATLKIVGSCFLALAAYIVFESSSRSGEIPRQSIAGICIALFSLVSMNVLAHAKRRVAHGISSAAMNADAKQSELCSRRFC